MAKDKKGSKAVVSAAAPDTSKPLETIKAGRVTKPIESAKAAAKDATKKLAKQVEMKSKKRDPTPESSSEDDDDTSASSASSDDESDEEVETTLKAKTNGAVNGKAAADDSGSDDDSESDSASSASDRDDEGAPKKVAAPKINGIGKAKEDDDSSSASDSDDEEGPKINGNAKAASGRGDESDDDSGSSSGSSGSDSDSDGDVEAGAEKVASSKGKGDPADSSSASSSDDEDDIDEVPKVAEAAKKRKAEDMMDQTPKKARVVTVNGEQKTAVGNLFVGNLSFNIDEEWLTREFEEFGELTGVRVITDRDSGRSKGYGYVEFVSADCAAEALETKNGIMIDGRNIRIDFSLPRPPKNDGFTPQQRSSERAQRYGDTPREPSKTLFVGNVSFRADETMVTELFQDFGTITAVRLPTDKNTEQMKGFGYVEFTSIDEAKAAFDGLQGAELEGRPLRLDYASERSNTNDSPRGGAWTRGGPRGGGGFSDRGGRGGRGGFNDRGRGGHRGGRGGTTNRGGFGDFSGKKISF